MADVTVEHCTFRIVRRGGWSWGPDPMGLAREAVRALEVVLSRYLVEAWPDDVDAVIADPIRITIPARLAEIADLAAGDLDDVHASGLHERVRAAFEAASVPVQALATQPGRDVGEPAGPAWPPAVEPAGLPGGPGEALSRWLAAWLRRGELEAVLNAVQARAIEDWHRVLFPALPWRAAVPGPAAGEAVAPGTGGGAEPYSSLPPRAEAGDLARPVAAGGPAARLDILRDRVRAAVAALLHRDASPAGPESLAAIDQALPWPPEPEASAVPRRQHRTDVPLEPLLWRLADWRRQGELSAVLRAMPEQTLDNWHRLLFSKERWEGSSAPGPGVATGPEIGPALGGDGKRRPVPLSWAEVDALIRSDVEEDLSARPGVLRARIWVAVSVVLDRGASPTAPEVLAAIDQALPWPVGPPSGPLVEGPSARGEERGLAGPLTVGAGATSRSRGEASPPGKGRAPLVMVGGVTGMARSALPFLLLGPLARTGYLEALDVLLGAAGLSSGAPLFATALAYKVLDPPERGWRRSPTDVATAALFAGLGAPAPGSAVVEFARQAAPVLPALDLVLASALARGHDPGHPLLLREVPGGGWLLAEVEGLFPVGWADDPDRLIGTLRSFGPTTVLVPRDSARIGLLERLGAAGVRFVTDAPPTRGEDWRPLRRPPDGRWWTNDFGTPEGPLVAAARDLTAAAEALADGWRELAGRRLGVVPGGGEAQGLERSLALASAVALADVAWTLWGGNEPTDPLLALQRFGDLDACVRIGPDEVRVQLPLGRRSRDLAKHRLLDDVASVPWLGGRVVRFSGG